MKEDIAQEALNLLSAPEIDDVVISRAAMLGDEAAQALVEAAYGKREGLAPKQRGHAVAILAATGGLDDANLEELAKDKVASVRNHALMALRNRRKPESLARALQEPGRDTEDKARILRALADVGDEAQVEEVLEWAGRVDDRDLRSLAASAVRTMQRRKIGEPRPDDLDHVAALIRSRAPRKSDD